MAFRPSKQKKVNLEMLRRNKSILTREELQEKAQSGQSGFPGLTTGVIPPGAKGRWEGNVFVEDKKPAHYADAALRYFSRDGLTDLDRVSLLEAHKAGKLREDEQLRANWNRWFPPSNFRDRSFDQFLNRLDAEIMRLEPRPESERDKRLREVNEALENRVISRNREIRNIEARSASGGPA